MNAYTKILIISPNLEPGFCGVSDYVFILQSFFKKAEIESALLALSDKYCKNIIEEENKLRIPFSTKSKIKISLANRFIESFKPDAIYFNLVSYGYNKKGFPFYLIKFLPQLSRKFNIIIIAHELWAGNFKNESIKNKMWGTIHRNFFISLFKKINISEIIVTTAIAKHVLNKYKIESKIISVFSNIPIEHYKNDSKEDSIIKLIFFGSSLFKIQSNLLIEFLLKLFVTHNKCIQINIVGRNNIDLVDWNKIASNFPNDKFLLVQHGFLSGKEVSLLMQKCSIGITTYMPIFWSKSGAIAAMVAHGLPVVSIAEEYLYDGFIDLVNLNPRLWSLNKILDENNVKELVPISLDYNYNHRIFEILFSEREIHC